MRLFACAFSCNCWMSAQFNVNYAAFTGSHGFKRGFAPGLDHLIHHAQGKLTDLLVTTFPIAFHIHHQLHPLLGLLSDHQRGNVLKRGQCFSVTTNERTQVITTNIHLNGAAIICTGFIIMSRDLRFHPKVKN